MNLDEIKSQRENRVPEVSYHKFNKKLKESEHPKYELVKDGPLDMETYERLRGTRNEEEYQMKWKAIQKKRREERQEDRTQRLTDPRV